MDCKYLIVSSVTYAIKAKNELEKIGIYSKVEKVKNLKSLNGCGFGVKVRRNEAVMAQRVLSAAGIRVLEAVDCGGGGR